ncbi:MAG: patatin-like phospholipase family protein [Novosphingobium sp.]
MPAATTKDSLTALVLQGGGALGAYQGGVYAALAAAGQTPDWVAGISIGAINAAIIAGNPPEKRISSLRGFWDRVSSQVTVSPLMPDGPLRTWFSGWSAGVTAMTGIPGFFEPRFPPPALAMPGSFAAISYYDTAPLRQTLLDFVDFDLINARATRFSVGAVNVLTGNFVYFDNHERTIGPEHVMASGALPPGFPPVIIDGEPYWDGGIVSNTPLQFVLDNRADGNITVFQVDLFSARGPMPLTIVDADQREKDIRFSSRTRLNTDMEKELLKLRAAMKRLAAKLPSDLKDDPDVQLLSNCRSEGAVTIMHLINRPEPYETACKDFEFSRQTVNGHWDSGQADAEHSLRHPRWTGRTVHSTGVVIFDLTAEPA